MRLLLFDIDGTLMSCGRQVGRRFIQALERVYGTTGDLESYSFAGKTDPSIVMDLMTGAGLESDDVADRMPKMKAAYLEFLGTGLDPSKMKLMPGVESILERLHHRDDVTTGLVTGNWEEGARVKLDCFGLNRYFAFGGFGEDGLDRNHLPPAALGRAHQFTGRRFQPDEAIVIGDTVLDVECALANDLRVLAVATGHTDARHLHAAGAHWVVNDLAEVDPEWLATI